MLKMFSKLFWALNKECLKHCDDDLRLLEDAMAELVSSWTDYIMSLETAPSTKELKDHAAACELVSRWSIPTA